MKKMKVTRCADDYTIAIDLSWAEIYQAYCLYRSTLDRERLNAAIEKQNLSTMGCASRSAIEIEVMKRLAEDYAEDKPHDVEDVLFDVMMEMGGWRDLK